MSEFLTETVELEVVPMQHTNVDADRYSWAISTLRKSSAQSNLWIPGQSWCRIAHIIGFSGLALSGMGWPHARGIEVQLGLL